MAFFGNNILSIPRSLNLFCQNEDRSKLANWSFPCTLIDSSGKSGQGDDPVCISNRDIKGISRVFANALESISIRFILSATVEGLFVPYP